MTKVHLNVKNLRHCLDVNCMPNKALAEGLGISASYLSQLLNQRRTPSPMLRKKLMEVLKCEQFDELFVISDATQGEKTV